MSTDSPIPTILSELRTRGLRSTPLRVALLVVLEKAHALDVPTLVHLLQKQGLSAQKAAVYRQLATLTAHGVVHASHSFAGATRYELARHEHHHHFVCTRCHAVEKIETGAIETELTVVERELAGRGFRVAQHALEILGTCPRCLN